MSGRADSARRSHGASARHTFARHLKNKGSGNRGCKTSLQSPCVENADVSRLSALVQFKAIEQTVGNPTAAQDEQMPS